MHFNSFKWFGYEIFWNNSKTQSYVQQGFIITQGNICYERGEKFVTVIIWGSSTRPYFIGLEEILMCFKLDFRWNLGYALYSMLVWFPSPYIDTLI